MCIAFSASTAYSSTPPLWRNVVGGLKVYLLSQDQNTNFLFVRTQAIRTTVDGGGGMTLIFEMSVKSWVKSYYANVRRVQPIITCKLHAYISLVIFSGKFEKRSGNFTLWVSKLNKLVLTKLHTLSCWAMWFSVHIFGLNCTRWTAYALIRKIIKMFYLLSQLKFYGRGANVCSFIYFFWYFL